MKKSVTYNDIKLFLVDYYQWLYNTNALNNMENLISYMLIKGVINEEELIKTITFRRKLQQQNDVSEDDSTKYEFIGR